MHKIILCGPRNAGKAKFAIALIACRVRFEGVGAKDIWNPASMPDDTERGKIRRCCCEAILDADHDTAILVRLNGWNRDTAAAAEWALARDCGLLVLDQWWA